MRRRGRGTGMHGRCAAAAISLLVLALYPARVRAAGSEAPAETRTGGNAPGVHATAPLPAGTLAAGSPRSALDTGSGAAGAAVADAAASVSYATGLSALAGSRYSYGSDERVKITVNVWGEVARPGSYLVPDNTDLVTLLSLAGGPTRDANLRTVRIARLGAAEPGSAMVDLESGLALGTVHGGGLLPGDTVQVPRRSAAGWAGALRTVYQVALVASTVAIVVNRTGR